MLGIKIIVQHFTMCGYFVYIKYVMPASKEPLAQSLSHFHGLNISTTVGSVSKIGLIGEGDAT